jgi:heme A synthase
VTRLVQILVWVTLTVVLVVNVASAYVRLAQQHVGCDPWPQCYGQTAPQDAGAVPSEDSPHFYVRALHRFSASLAAVLLLAIAFLGWEQWKSAAPRIAAIVLLALAGGLTWLGVRTPSAAPVVTLGNVVGGMAMLAVLAWLAAWRPGRASTGGFDGGLAGWTRLALVLVFAQVALGALVNARYGVGACTGLPDCAGSWWPHGDTTGAFDVFRPTVVPIAPSDEAVRQAVHMAHRLFAVIAAGVTAAVGIVTLRRPAGPRAAAALLLTFLFVQLALGAIMVTAAVPLAVATLHNANANLLLAAIAWMLGRLRTPWKGGFR